MTDQQNPQKGAEPAVTSNVEQDDAAVWAELNDAEQAPDLSAEADVVGDSFSAEADRGTGDDEPSQVATAEAKGEGQSEPDIWKDASPAAREAFEKLEREKKQLEHETRSQEGRAAARIRRIAELQKQLEELGTKPDADEGTPLNALAEDYPEISKVIETVAAKADKVEAAHKSRLQAELETETTAVNADLKREEALLNDEHPGWLDYLKQNGPAFSDWVDDQPKRIRAVFQQNAANIVDGRAVADLVASFKAHLNPPAAEPDPQTNPMTTRRERQLGASSSPARSARQPVVSGIPAEGDDQEIWDAIGRDEARKQR